MTQYKALGLDGDIPPHMQLLEMICGKWVSQAIFAAAELGIADQLNNEPRSSDEVAQAVGAKAETTYRLMRALGSLGILEESDNRCFSLTDIGQYLRRDHNESMRNYARLIGYECNWRAWESLDKSVMTGKTGYEIAYGMEIFDYMSSHPPAAKIFNDGMVVTNHAVALQVASAYDFAEIPTLVDVGGGTGSLIAALLESNSEMRGIIYDMKHATEDATNLLDERRLHERCEFVTGNFFQDIPKTHSCVLKSIIHDWDDEHSIRILKNCVKAIAQDGKVLLVERIVPPPGQSHISKLLDLEMLALTSGIERTIDEYQALFEQAGLQVTNVITTSGASSIIEGKAAS